MVTLIVVAVSVIAIVVGVAVAISVAVAVAVVIAVVVTVTAAVVVAVTALRDHALGRGDSYGRWRQTPSGRLDDRVVLLHPEAGRVCSVRRVELLLRLDGLAGQRLAVAARDRLRRGRRRGLGQRRRDHDRAEHTCQREHARQ
jgi:hypothetical protein